MAYQRLLVLYVLGSYQYGASYSLQSAFGKAWDAEDGSKRDGVSCRKQKGLGSLAGVAASAAMIRLVTSNVESLESNIMQDVNNIIIDVLSVTSHDKPICKVIQEDRIIKLCELAREVLKPQGSLIELDAPVRICGDIHGQFPDLIRLFHRGGWPPLSNYLFLGDYVDRGRFNIETALLLLAYKVRFPKNFFMLRGNHECEFVNKTYGFYEECQKRYQSTRVYDVIQDTFTYLPMSGLVGDRILCMHGGLSPELRSLNDLRTIARPNFGKSGIEVDLLWADPVSGLTGFVPNQRGAGVGFGKDVVLKTCSDLGLDLICRAHQVVQDGYEFFAGRKLVTIFSAPHYCGQFDNCAAFMICDEKLQCSFEILRPTNGRLEVREKPLLKDETN